MSKDNQFCRECGSKLLSQQVLGNNVQVHMMDSGGGCWWNYTSKFDPETGEEKMVEVRKCPNYKRGFFGSNSHDIFMVDGDSIEWGVKITS